MSAEPVRADDGSLIAMRITCDECGAEAPPYDQILSGGGLVRMGWQCVSQRHICPEHPHD